ncbi:MAG: hypothetical protein NZ772_01410 [Cyanobacteria bacterium]|nr:hypothetical protein [Cyanobacteriota bacterium]MDW8200120.1 hypothetical protein [Cyanobacteriota bacterium SKYGB_h_bin112]
MTVAESCGETVPVQFPDGAVVNVKVTSTGREDVGFDVQDFQPVANAIKRICG